MISNTPVVNQIKEVRFPLYC